MDDKCPLVDIKLEDITKKFSKLEANILGVIRNEKFTFLKKKDVMKKHDKAYVCLLYTSPSPRDRQKSRMPSSA